MLGAAAAVLLVPRGGAPATQAPVGASSDGYAVWARNADGTPVRWDPCSPIVIVASEVGSPDGYALEALTTDLEQAASVLAEASGLDLDVVGSSDEAPGAGRSTLAAGDRSRWAPILVGWHRPGHGSLPLRDVDRGVAVPVAVGSPGERVYVTGQIALNPDRTDLVPGFDDRATSWGSTVTHELAHVLGLAHVDDPAQLLHTYPGAGPVVLGGGDRAGLRAVGADLDCLDVPEPVELDVAVPTR